MDRPFYRDSVNRISEYRTVGPGTILRFIPLKRGEHVLGMLCLRIQHPVPWFASIARMRQARSTSSMDFFWTFLEQATSLLERAQLRATVRGSYRGEE